MQGDRYGRGLNQGKGQVGEDKGGQGEEEVHREEGIDMKEEVDSVWVWR